MVHDCSQTHDANMYIISSITKVQFGAGWLHSACAFVPVVIKTMVIIWGVWTRVYQLFSSAERSSMGYMRQRQNPENYQGIHSWSVDAEARQVTTCRCWDRNNRAYLITIWVYERYSTSTSSPMCSSPRNERTHLQQVEKNTIHWEVCSDKLFSNSPCFHSLQI